MEQTKSYCNVKNSNNNAEKLMDDYLEDKNQKGVDIQFENINYSVFVADLQRLKLGEYYR